MNKKREFNIDKYSWHPSPLAGQIVLMTTVDEEGNVDVAPKSWVTMIAFNPPTLVVGCNRKHTTAINLTKVPEFVVNIPGEELVRRIFEMPLIESPRSIERLGLTPLESLKVSPPSIEECHAHLECKLIRIDDIGEDIEVAILGEILGARIDEDILKGENIDRYNDLRPVFFLEEGTYGVIDLARSVGGKYTDSRCYLVSLADQGDVSVHLNDHMSFLKQLQINGNLVQSGSFPDEHSGGMYILKVLTFNEAETLVRKDPLVKSGACTYQIREFRRSI